MAINVSVQHNGGIPDGSNIGSPDWGMLRRSIDAFIFFFKNQVGLQPLIPPKRFDISPPRTGGCSEGLGAF